MFYPWKETAVAAAATLTWVNGAVMSDNLIKVAIVIQYLICNISSISLKSNALWTVTFWQTHVFH